ncbi:RNA-directed DNA polymerase (reverse transcriptase)-related family protein [Rhynchospora pubera]|uniref:RNA-directed DNA polymerase (Reverse transcriptase)-related family protein n=1 Tax=Rhynchospora pubera TaxID=906938 RepID=A0AAV8FR12_9POAL|nr:RNA-directed DNA polymerase (reverse transcriptase)-related family protein [Rhynchospora pubera]
MIACYGDGDIAVNTRCQQLISMGKIYTPCIRVWSIKVTPSVQLFVFLLLNGRISTQDMLLRKGLQVVPGCALCGSNTVETALHLFFQCSFACQFWSEMSRVTAMPNPSLKDTVLESILATCKGFDGASKRGWEVLTLLSLWTLWCERNHRIFRGKQRPVQILVQKVLQEERYLNGFATPIT